jgi:hypothetical protein
MTRRAQDPTTGPDTEVPAVFQHAVKAVRGAIDGEHREELELDDMPAPQRLAPYSTALTASVYRDDTEIAAGRLIILYDPAGRPGWAGGFRLVAYRRGGADRLGGLELADRDPGAGRLRRRLGHDHQGGVGGVR